MKVACEITETSQWENRGRGETGHPGETAAREKPDIHLSGGREKPDIHLSGGETGHPSLRGRNRTSISPGEKPDIHLS
jgi:hypothetical protein